MVVGDDMPVLVDDKPRAQAAPPELALRPPFAPEETLEEFLKWITLAPEGAREGHPGDHPALSLDDLRRADIHHRSPELLRQLRKIRRLDDRDLTRPRFRTKRRVPRPGRSADHHSHSDHENKQHCRPMTSVG